MTGRIRGIHANFHDTLLVVCPTWVGDTVMATPVYRALREQLPQARLIALVQPGLEEILEGCAWFDERVAARRGGALGALRARRHISRIKPHAALLLPNSFSSALGAFLAGVPNRIGYGRDGRTALLTHAVAVPKRSAPESTVRYYAQLAAAVLGVDSIDERLELHCSKQQLAAAKAFLPRDVQKNPLVVLNPGANRPDKRWPAERFAAVGDALVESHDATVVVTGSPAEQDVVERVLRSAAHHERFMNLAQRGITLGSLKAILSRASLLITNDTGPRHMAIAFGTPVVSLFGPTDYRWTRIETASERALLAEPFLPEDLIADRNAQCCSIDRIAVGDVIHAARQLL